jgi:hypothetical protein
MTPRLRFISCHDVLCDREVDLYRPNARKESLSQFPYGSPRIPPGHREQRLRPEEQIGSEVDPLHEFLQNLLPLARPDLFANDIRLDIVDR